MGGASLVVLACDWSRQRLADNDQRDLRGFSRSASSGFGGVQDGGGERCGVGGWLVDVQGVGGAI